LARCRSSSKPQRPKNTAATFIAWVQELLIYALLGLGANGPAFRALDAPTSDGWIDPWITHLEHLGARLHLPAELTGFNVQDGSIGQATVKTSTGDEPVIADWYVCALPVERARQLWNGTILNADPRLADMNRLNTAWMNSVQHYLRERTPILDGVTGCVDSPWAASFLTQAQFWSTDFASNLW
jgi:hypothetical protein